MLLETRRLVLVLLLCASFGVLAAEEPVVSKRTLDPARFAELRAMIEKESEPGGRFSLGTERERDDLARHLDRIATILARAPSVDELSEPDRVALFNAQERANGILTKNDRDRLVCQRHSQIGSHRKVTTCETVGERIARMERAKIEARELGDRRQMCREVTVGPVANSGSGGIDCL